MNKQSLAQCLILNSVLVKGILNLFVVVNQLIAFTRKIMDKHIRILEDNDQICECVGLLGSLLLLVAKLDQGDYTGINDVVWHLCVSNRPLNSITRSFEFHILLYADSIEDIGDSSGRMYLFLQILVLHIIRFERNRVTRKSQHFSRKMEKIKLSRSGILVAKTHPPLRCCYAVCV